MSTETSNLKLTKPLETENYDINIFNENFDKIDDAVNKNTTQLNDKVNKSSVINNCSTTEEGFVADARQLKYLKEYIDEQLNGSVKKPYTHDSGIDGNTILTTGWHRCNTNVNAPAQGEYYILVINPYGTLIRQVWFGIWVDSGIYTRTCDANNNWTWSSFKKLENE